MPPTEAAVCDRVDRQTKKASPPATALKKDNLEDVFAWGKWVAERDNITPEESQKMLKTIRKKIHNK